MRQKKSVAFLAAQNVIEIRDAGLLKSNGKAAGCDMNKTGPHLVTISGADRLENWSQLDIPENKTRKGK